MYVDECKELMVILHVKRVYLDTQRKLGELHEVAPQHVQVSTPHLVLVVHLESVKLTRLIKDVSSIFTEWLSSKVR